MEYARVAAARVPLECCMDVLRVGILYVWLENVFDILTCNTKFIQHYLGVRYSLKEAWRSKPIFGAEDLLQVLNRFMDLSIRSKIQYAFIIQLLSYTGSRPGALLASPHYNESIAYKVRIPI